MKVTQGYGLAALGGVILATAMFYFFNRRFSALQWAGLRHFFDSQRKYTDMKFAELATALQGLVTKVEKIGTESSTSLQKLADLQAAVDANKDDVPQDVQDAVAALTTQLQKVDDLVPDAATLPTVPTTDTNPVDGTPPVDVSTPTTGDQAVQTQTPAVPGQPVDPTA